VATGATGSDGAGAAIPLPDARMIPVEPGTPPQRTGRTPSQGGAGGRPLRDASGQKRSHGGDSDQHGSPEGGTPKRTHTPPRTPERDASGVVGVIGPPGLTNFPVFPLPGSPSNGAPALLDARDASLPVPPGVTQDARREQGAAGLVGESPALGRDGGYALELALADPTSGAVPEQTALVPASAGVARDLNLQTALSAQVATRGSETHASRGRDIDIGTCNLTLPGAFAVARRQGTTSSHSKAYGHLGCACL